MKHVLTTSCVKDLFFRDVSILPMLPCIWVDACVERLWCGFTPSYVLCGRRAAGGNAAAPQFSEETHGQDTHIRTHTVYTWSWRQKNGSISQDRRLGCQKWRCQVVSSQQHPATQIWAHQPSLLCWKYCVYQGLSDSKWFNLLCWTLK